MNKNAFVGRYWLRKFVYSEIFVVQCFFYGENTKKFLNCQLASKTTSTNKYINVTTHSLKILEKKIIPGRMNYTQEDYSFIIQR